MIHAIKMSNPSVMSEYCMMTAVCRGEVIWTLKSDAVFSSITVDYKYKTNGLVRPSTGVNVLNDPPPHLMYPPGHLDLRFKLPP